MNAKLNQSGQESVSGKDGSFGSKVDVEKYKKRILQWPNPVEFVNNMYGCHPDDEGREYFKKVFSE